MADDPVTVRPGGPQDVERGLRVWAAQLWTQATNNRALRLYEHRGFVRTGREAVVDGERIVQLATAEERGP